MVCRKSTTLSLHLYVEAEAVLSAGAMQYVARKAYSYQSIRKIMTATMEPCIGLEEL